MEIKKISDKDLKVFGQAKCDKDTCEYDCCGTEWNGNRSKTDKDCKKESYANSHWSSGS